MIRIRTTGSADLPAIERLYRITFPDEDLVPLVRSLLREVAPPPLSLAATDGTTIAGHVVFTPAGIAGCAQRAALMAPLAVMPNHQRQGIGGMLVRCGLDRLRASCADGGVDIVCVLGDATYYSRFGFRPERGLAPPYALPEAWHDAWQSLKLTERGHVPVGKIELPDAWMHPALWLP